MFGLRIGNDPRVVVTTNLIAGDGTWRNRRASAADQQPVSYAVVKRHQEESMDQQRHYVGLDVSLETTSICVIDDAGAIIWRGKCASDPEHDHRHRCANMRQARCGSVWRPDSSPIG